MALVSVSAKCFNNIETALKAVKMGDIRRSEAMLKSVKEDGLFLQRAASVLCYRLREAEDKHKQQVEAITEQINELYQEQKQHEKRKQELETNISSLTYEKERYRQSKRDASRKYQEAQREKREAEEKYEELEKYFWVPFYGLYLGVRELVERNDNKARAAQREMASYERDMERADRDIAWANSGIYQVSFVAKRTQNNKDIFFHKFQWQGIWGSNVCILSLFCVLHIHNACSCIIVNEAQFSH